MTNQVQWQTISLVQFLLTFHRGIHRQLCLDMLWGSAHLYNFPGRQGSFRFLDEGKMAWKICWYAIVLCRINYPMRCAS